MGRIGDALLKYHDAYGQFPPASIADDEGEPMHSWRVLILPQLGHDTLYADYQFDEPWDGPNNRRLARRMPEVYRCPSYQHHLEHDREWSDKYLARTQYVAPVADDTVMRPDGALKLGEFAAIGTAMVVEIGRPSVHWMSPTDIAAADFVRFLQDGDKESLNHTYGSQCFCADGTVQFLHAKMMTPAAIADLLRANASPAVVTESPE